MVKKVTLKSVPILEDNFRTVITSPKYVPSETVAGPLMVIKSKYTYVSSETITFVLKHWRIYS
jgi:hypothetical protein